MKKILFVTTILLAVSACKTSKLPKEKTVAETNLEDFTSFAGITMGDLEDETIKKFKEPTEITKRRSRSMYFYDDEKGTRIFKFTIKKNSNKVNHIRLTGDRNTDYESTKAFFTTAGIKDPKVNFLGMHKDEIIKILGQPLEATSSRLVYKQEPVKITFSLSPFRDNKCSEIYLFWNYSYKKPVE